MQLTPRFSHRDVFNLSHAEWRSSESSLCRDIAEPSGSRLRTSLNRFSEETTVFLYSRTDGTHKLACVY
jgi:hypothetical protein